MAFILGFGIPSIFKGMRWAELKQQERLVDLSAREQQEAHDCFRAFAGLFTGELICVILLIYCLFTL